ncbi:MAG: glycosyl hydrolase, partial [Synergistaceae bacterium]|nr:glycosyl hydrolase [Synergistaceae bacterium]
MDVKEVISQMTLEEKAGLCSGRNFWFTKDVERLNVQGIMLSDGPHGLRKQASGGDHLGVSGSVEAICFPTASAIAASFDRDLIREMGEALGDECQAEEVGIILGPGVNIKRSPLCGRNFEFLSEDPYQSTEMATEYIKGVQSKNVGTSLKHFLANNQEHRRMSSSSEIDERTLREIYLAAFEGAVVKAKPWTVMCSYNKVNGIFASENPRYLTDILRGEWGFDGYVVSDWGAVSDRVEALKAGVALEMPSSSRGNDERIVEAVKNGTLDEKILDQTVERILTVHNRYIENKKPDAAYDKEKHHQLARKILSECMVLLKNDGILPLKKGDDIAFIGEFAEKPRFQGGGSSHINSFKITSALETMKGALNITYAKGYDTEEDRADEVLIREAVEAAKRAKIAVVFAGLPDIFESEGYDRSHMSLPECQNRLIREVAAVQPDTVVVLHNGSPVEMPWVQDVKGILEVYLGGESVGEATADVLFGDVNPSGKLAETFPIRLEDNPSYLFYFGEKDIVEYREGIFVGYRYYDKKKLDVLFPFGHGLSYTTFDYSSMKVSADVIKDTDTLTVKVDVTNTGKAAGKEVVQLYVGDRESSVIRPVKELKGFEKVALNPGETKTVSFTLGKRAFAYYNTEISDWHVETGEFDILIGKSSRDILCTKTVVVESTVALPVVYTINSNFADVMEDPEAMAACQPLWDSAAALFKEGNPEGENGAEQAIMEKMVENMVKVMPLRAAINFGDGSITYERINSILEKI